MSKNKTVETIKRAPGYYWVRLFCDNWQPAEWALYDSGEYVWYMIGNSIPFCSDDFEQIGEEVTERGYINVAHQMVGEAQTEIEHVRKTNKFLLIWGLVLSAALLLLIAKIAIT